MATLSVTSEAKISALLRQCDTTPPGWCHFPPASETLWETAARTHNLVLLVHPGFTSCSQIYWSEVSHKTDPRVLNEMH